MRLLARWPLPCGDGEKAFVSGTLGTWAEEKAFGPVGLGDVVFPFLPLVGGPLSPHITVHHHTSPEWLGV